MRKSLITLQSWKSRIWCFIVFLNLDHSEFQAPSLPSLLNLACGYRFLYGAAISLDLISKERARKTALGNWQSAGFLVCDSDA